MNYKKSILFLTFSSLLIVGCGGGGGDSKHIINKKVEGTWESVNKIDDFIFDYTLTLKNTGNNRYEGTFYTVGDKKKSKCGPLHSESSTNVIAYRNNDALEITVLDNSGDPTDRCYKDDTHVKSYTFVSGDVLHFALETDNNGNIRSMTDDSCAYSIDTICTRDEAIYYKIKN